MKTSKIRNGVLAALALLPSVAYAQDQGAAAIQKRLESEYKLTKTTDDKSDIVTAGSVLLLHKDKVLMFAATSSANPCMNTYRDGRITQSKACKLGGGLMRAHFPIPGSDRAPATRNFVSGEKFWVTRIDVKDTGKEHGVVFDFFTDATPAGDQGIRYKGELMIPFGALTPTPDEALKAVAEVVTVVPSEDSKEGDQAKQPAPEGGPPEATPPSQPAAPAAAEAPPPPIEPPPPPPAQPAEVTEGQTIDQVVAALGQPVKKAKVGTKDIYYYKDLKVTFINGKVKDIQ